MSYFEKLAVIPYHQYLKLNNALKSQDNKPTTKTALPNNTRPSLTTTREGGEIEQRDIDARITTPRKENNATNIPTGVQNNVGGVQRYDTHSFLNNISGDEDDAQDIYDIPDLPMNPCDYLKTLHIDYSEHEDTLFSNKDDYTKRGHDLEDHQQQQNIQSEKKKKMKEIENAKKTQRSMKLKIPTDWISLSK